MLTYCSFSALYMFCSTLEKMVLFIHVFVFIAFDFSKTEI